MSPQIVEHLDPQPFRDWADSRIRESDNEAVSIGATAMDTTVRSLARDLGLSERRLYAWRFENKSLERIGVEEALHRVDVGLWEVYPEFEDIPEDGPSHGYCTHCHDEVPVGDDRSCMWCGERAWKSRSGVQPGTGTKVTDAQLRQLHALYERGATKAELGRRIWKHAGYSSALSASEAIRLGFKRLHLPSAGQRTAYHRRCSGIKSQSPNRGRRCGRHTMLGSEFCREHDPARRDEVLESTAKALGLVAA